MVYFKAKSFGVCFGTLAAYYSSSKSVKAKEMIDCHECHMKRLPKARELPLYEKEGENLTVEYDQNSKLPLISEISGIRSQLSEIVSYLNVFKQEAVHIYKTGLAHSKSSYDYITNDENKITRVLTIATGGLSGIFLARKGGYLKKVTYALLGTGIVFSVFYPSTSKDYLLASFEYTKEHSSNILEKYGGYDPKKIAEETNARVEYIKNTLNVDGLSDKMKEWFDKNKETVTNTINNTLGTSPKTEKNGPDKTSN